MHSTWLHRTRQRECILFLSGWGMDPGPFRFLPATGCDLCMVADYRQLEPLALEPFAGYDRLHLVAWSMGVWVAGHLLAGQTDAFDSRVALAGTLIPVDQQRGLPPENYAAMAESFTQETLEAFYRSMFDGEEEFARFLTHRPQRQLEDLHEELVAFNFAFLQNGPGRDIFTRKIITSRDRVFPGRNQMRAWGKGNGLVTAWPHFPFYRLTDWRDLLDSL